MGNPASYSNSVSHPAVRTIEGVGVSATLEPKTCPMLRAPHLNNIYSLVQNTTSKIPNVYKHLF